MQFIKNLFTLLIVYVLLLSIYLGLTFYLRPDIRIEDFIHNPYYWIGPAILLYIVLNFKRIFYGIINKIIIVFVLFFGLNHFFPQFGNTLKEYVGFAIPSSDSIKKQANEILTPKNGMEPKYQFNTNSKSNSNYKKSVEDNNSEQTSKKDGKSKQKNIPTESNDTNNVVEYNEDYSKTSITDNIKNIPSKVLDTLPKETTNKLKDAGVDIENPINTLENIQNKKKELKDSFLK